MTFAQLDCCGRRRLCEIRRGYPFLLACPCCCVRACVAASGTTVQLKTSTGIKYWRRTSQQRNVHARANASRLVAPGTQPRTCMTKKNSPPAVSLHAIKAGFCSLRCWWWEKERSGHFFLAFNLSSWAALHTAGHQRDPASPPRRQG